MANRTKLTTARKRKFLELLRDGQSITKACDAIAMSRQGMYDAREANKDFAIAWDDAVESGTDKCEDEAMRRAVQGYDEPVFYQGEIVGTVKRHSDTLLMFVLRARRPTQYRDNSTIEHKGSIEVEYVNDWRNT